jgi:hypothetical protein
MEQSERTDLPTYVNLSSQRSNIHMLNRGSGTKLMNLELGSLHTCWGDWILFEYQYCD